MQNSIFFIEKNENICENYLLNFRRLYLPILGSNSYALYSYFYDLLSSKNTLYNSFNLEDMSKSLFLEPEDVLVAKKRLEAAGLIKSFINIENNKNIISFLKPLNFSKFNQNKFLKRELIKKIGELRFEKLYLENKSKLNSKDGYLEDTIKFSDVFSIEIDDNFSEKTTSEINLPVNLSLEKAIEELSSIHFIKYIFQKTANIAEINLINYCASLGFSDKSINLFLNYSFLKNDKLVINFIKKIAQDFFERDLLLSKEIEYELSLAQKGRQKIEFNNNLWDYDNKIEDKNKNLIASETKELSLYDLLEETKGIN
ncbi:MAG: DnaD domain protein [Metamycoplasmataceae bacterium]